MKIAVIGDGGWGTATAMLLSSYGHDVCVWGPFADYVDEIRSTRTNPRYLKGVEIELANLGYISLPFLGQRCRRTIILCAV